MRVLTVCQPWAYLLAAGIKDVENRTRRTYYRGPLLILASRRMATTSVDAIEQRFRIRIPRDLPTGGIVGIATIVDCVTASNSRWFEGPLGWVVDSAHELPLIPAKGALHLFEPSAELAHLVRRAERRQIATAHAST